MRKICLACLTLFLIYYPLGLLAQPVTLDVLAKAKIDAPTFEKLPESSRWFLQHQQIRIGVVLTANAGNSTRFSGITAEYVALLQHAFPVNVVVLQYASLQQAITALRKGEIELISDVNAGSLTDLTVSLPYQSDNSFAALKVNKALIASINSLLKQLPLHTKSTIASTWGVEEDDGTNNLFMTITHAQRQWARQHPLLSVLVVNTHVPLTFLDEDNEESGFSVALLQKLAERIGIRLKFQHFTDVPAMRAHLRNNPDSLIAVSDASAPADPGMIYSTPYVISGWVLIIPSDSETTSLAESAGKRIAVFKGSYILDILRKRYPQVEFVEEQFSLEMAFSLWRHSLDGAIIPRVYANYFQQTNLGNHFKTASPLVLPPLRIAMASSTQNQPLIEIINNVLADYSPQTLDSQLSGWQMRHAHELINNWVRYRDLLVMGLLIVALLLSTIVWRNRFLKRSLIKEQRLQAELREAQQLAESANRSKSTFLSQMSHEIRTPMNALTGLLELEYLGRSSPQQSKSNITVAYESARSLMLLVGDILDMAKIESGTLQVKLSVVSLPDTLNNCMTLFRAAAEEKNISLTAEFSLQQADVQFDSVMLRQIISNLLSNAIKFTPEHGQIELALYQGDTDSEGIAQYALEVCDSGIGLTPEQQNTIFDPFIQVDEAQGDLRGTGLGLSICCQLSELLGGTLTVESVPGEGATFIFRFGAQPAAERSQTAPQTIEPATISRFILVIDDHAPNRLLLSQQLEFAGHRCVAVENAQQGLIAWAETPEAFDLIITDCNMPGMSGFAFARRLREVEAASVTAPTTLVGFTAMAEQGVREQALAAGMTDCMFKPLDLRQLLARIEVNDTQSDSDVEKRVILTSLNKLAQSDANVFQSLMQTVIEQNRYDLKQLQAAIQAEDFSEIGAIAHSIVNTAKMIDANTLEDISRDIEQAAAVKKSTRMSDLFMACEASCNALEITLLEHCNNIAP